MRIALLSPRGPLYRHRKGAWKKSLRYAPLTLTTLAALVPEQLNADIMLVDEGIEDIDCGLDADLVGMTVITGSAPRCYELSGRFRSRGVPVVLGGPHVTLMPDEAALHADSIVVGYAEESWPELLRDFGNGCMKPRYVQRPGLELRNLPFPRRDMIPAGRYVTTATFEATRGCINDCDFCVVPTAWGRKPYLKPVEEVVADIRQYGAREVLFLDLNLMADPSHAAALFESLVPLSIRWYGLSTTVIASDEKMTALAARSGCRGLLLGFESLVDESLHDIGKGYVSPGEYLNVVRTLHRHGIAVQGCFVFGMDHDDAGVFMRTARFTVDARIDLPRFAIRTPFPGTPLFRQLSGEGRILTENWELYDCQHVVFRPALMSAEELFDGHLKAWKYAYRYGSIIRRLGAVRYRLGLIAAANLGYRFYCNRIRRFASNGGTA
ncbi:MAG: B12-binding domain-containing radical SAM protein [Planctomycetes bacterium]|nr:B12-binding domain-containing radical SAM protein [Planctomycetota bacterium]